MGSVFFVMSYNFYIFNVFQELYWIFFLSFPVSFVWVITTLAETNRSPFDFAEGESELVSGFNIEYGAGGFALIFIAEYGSILVMRVLTSAIFYGCGNILFCSDFFFILKGFFFCFFFL